MPGTSCRPPGHPSHPQPLDTLRSQGGLPSSPILCPQVQEDSGCDLAGTAPRRGRSGNRAPGPDFHPATPTLPYSLPPVSSADFVPPPSQTAVAISRKQLECPVIGRKVSGPRMEHLLSASVTFAEFRCGKCFHYPGKKQRKEDMEWYPQYNFSQAKETCKDQEKMRRGGYAHCSWGDWGSWFHF